MSRWSFPFPDRAPSRVVRSTIDWVGRHRGAVLSVVAMTSGLVAVVLAERQIGQEVERRTSDLRTHYQKVSVVVPREDLPSGALVARETMAAREVPAEFLQRDAVMADRFDSVAGRRIAIPVAAGKPLLWSQLAGDAAKSLANRIPAGRRALTVAVDEISALSGHLFPGDHVDLMASLPQGDERLVLTLLESVQVLATGSETDTDHGLARGPEAGERGFRTVTVDVSPDDARRVILAQELGRVTAVLRRAGDATVAPPGRSTVASLLERRGERMALGARSAATNRKTPVEYIVGGESP